MSEVSQRIGTRAGLWDASLRKGIEAVPPQALLIAAVFFVRYDYSYQREGFWQPFLDALGVEFTQNHRAVFTQQFERAFRHLDLYRPTGGYRYVSPLIYHSVLPNDGIRHFAEIIAHQETHWGYWASADTDEIVAFLRSEQVSTNMRRLLEHDGKLVADLFTDVCDYLATGMPTSDVTCGLDVEAIASAVKEHQERDRQGGRESVSRTRHDQWYIPQPAWVWQRSDSRIGVRIPAMRLAGEPGEFVRAALRVGSHEIPLDVDIENHRTAPLFVDSWFLDMDSGTTPLELICDGHERAKRTVTTLDRTSPIGELNGVLVPLRLGLDVPPKAWWLLPDGTVVGDGIDQVASEVAPFPLNRWQAGLFAAAGQKFWTFRREGIQSQDFRCNIERRQSWMLRAGSQAVCLDAGSSAGPVLTDWPEIELLGDSWEDGFVCEVRNLSTGEQQTYGLGDVVEQGEDGVRLISHRSLCHGLDGTIGCFRVKLKTTSFRTVNTAPAIYYCFVPLLHMRVPRVVWPQAEHLEMQACLGDPLGHMEIRAVRAAHSECDGMHIKARWPAGTDAGLELNTPVPLRLRLRVPRISWEVDGSPASGHVVLPETAATDASRRLVLTTDPEQPARLDIGSWYQERPEGVSHWVVPLTAFYEPLEKATSRTVSVSLAHAGGTWEVLRFRRNLVVESIMSQQWGPVLYVKVRLSAETEDHLYAIAARVGDTKTTVRTVELDSTGEEGAVIDVDDVQFGKWCVVFRLCPGDSPSHGELLRDDEGGTALLEVDFGAAPRDFSVPSREPSVADELLACADWELPLRFFAPHVRRSSTDVLRDELLASLARRSGEEGRRAMEHLAAEGINFASFPPATGNAPERALFPEDLVNLWQPLAVPGCTSVEGGWPESVVNLLGCPHEHPLFLPKGTVVHCGNELYAVTGGHALHSVDGETYDRFELHPLRGSDGTRFLLFGDCDHRAALLTEETLPLADSDDMVAVRRVNIDPDSIPALLDGSWSQGLRVIYENRVPAPILPMVFMFVNEGQPAYRQEFLVKGYWQWTHGSAQTRGFRHYWEKARQDCAAVYPWLREHLGEERDGVRLKRLFAEELTVPCRKVLIHITRQIEQAFPFHHDSGAYAYPGLLYVLAVYNRLAARYPEKTAGIRAESRGREWLCEHSAVAFRDARLMFNYWLILVESILNWWNQEEGSDRQA